MGCHSQEKLENTDSILLELYSLAMLFTDSEGASCHAVGCPKDRSMPQGAQGSSSQWPARNWPPQPNSHGGADTCWNHTTALGGSLPSAFRGLEPLPTPGPWQPVEALRQETHPSGTWTPDQRSWYNKCLCFKPLRFGAIGCTSTDNKYWLIQENNISGVCMVKSMY